MKILIIEDEVKIAHFMGNELRSKGYIVDETHSYDSALVQVENNEYDILCVDIHLGNQSGIDLIKTFRKDQFAGGIILVTAYNTTKTKITGLDAGADDYLTKPFELDELHARIRSLARRLNKGDSKLIYTLEDLSLNIETRTVLRGDKKIELSNREFTLLKYLMMNPNKILSRMQISENVWNTSFETDTNIVDVYINMLRKKIDYPFEKKLIHTIVGAGYALKLIE